jgi:DNA topoisomerase-3
MLYDLTTLQREANNRYGFSAKRTLAAAQRSTRSTRR